MELDADKRGLTRMIFLEANYECGGRDAGGGDGGEREWGAYV